MDSQMNENPWISIWTHPRATISKIVEENPNRSLWALASIYGFCSLLNLFQSMALGYSVGTVSILFLAIIFAPLWGWANFGVWSFVVAWTGRWLKGKGEFKNVRAAYAWSCVPFIINVPLWVLMVALFGSQMFANFPDAHLLSDTMVFLLFIILVVKVVVAVWSLVIYLNALSQVQHFSMLKAILNVVISGALLGVVFYLAWSLLIYTLSGDAVAAMIFWKI
jgi:hypothetical protein